MSERFAYLLVLLGGILWGTTGTAQTFIPETVDPFMIACLRLALGGLILSLGLLLLGKLTLSKLAWKPILIVALILALFQLSFFTSVRLTGVAIGTVLSIGSAPLFAGLMEWLLLGQRPSNRWLLASSFAIVGTILLFLNKELLIFDSRGVLLAILAGFLFASYSFFNKRVLESLPPMNAVALVFSLSALMLLPFSLFFSGEGLLTRTGLLAILYIGIVTTAIGYLFFTIGLKYIPSSAATTLSLAEPFTAAILSVVIVGEYLSRSAWFGVCLILLGILILTALPQGILGASSRKSGMLE